MTAFAVCLAGHPHDDAPPRLAAAAEAAGLDALFLPENSHVPLTRRAPDKFRGDMRLLARFYDPFVTLAACAAVTTRLRLGTSVSLLTQREPLVTARTVASLDHLADGRLVLGVAGGFIREAMAHHGSRFPERWPLVRERVAAMRAMWCEAAPVYRGELVTLPSPCPAFPTRQPGGPPIWIGSNSRAVPGRVAAWADGWLVRPDVYPGDPHADLARACDEHGRARATVTLALMDAPTDPQQAMQAVAAGYDVLVFILRGDDQRGLLRGIDALGTLARQLRGDA
ncbi:MAG: TIGR03619 family F420-dependent LLM class oxidoreductase [Gammaproteobacteria bacterium]